MTEQATTTVLGSNIRAERNRKDMTQAELAKRAGLSAAFISRLENGRSDARTRTVRDLADALDVPISRLLDEV